VLSGEGREAPRGGERRGRKRKSGTLFSEKVSVGITEPRCGATLTLVLLFAVCPASLAVPSTQQRLSPTETSLCAAATAAGLCRRVNRIDRCHPTQDAHLVCPYVHGSSSKSTVGQLRLGVRATILHSSGHRLQGTTTKQQSIPLAHV